MQLGENKAVAQRLLVYNFKHKCDHMFTDNASLCRDLSDHGYCFLHKRPCRRSISRPDISSGGFMCEPYSAARQKHWSKNNTGTAVQHPPFKHTISHFITYIRVRSPYLSLSFIIKWVMLLRSSRRSETKRFDSKPFDVFGKRSMSSESVRCLRKACLFVLKRVMMYSKTVSIQNRSMFSESV